MDPEVRLLFHQVAGLAPEDRARTYEQLGSSGRARVEVESLLEYDTDDALTGAVTRAAQDLLADSTAEDARRCGPYRLVRLLGTGGMGSVYLGERSDGELQQQVAIKMLRTDQEHALRESRFLKERQLLASLKHPSIVHVLDAGKTAIGRPYLVMEYVEGMPIDRYAEKLSLSDRLRLFLRVCEGVSHAHQHLIIHRDLKPSNILVDAAGHPKLLDFGIAKLLDDDNESTQTVDRLLTPGYASPEQLRGDIQSTSTDIYSLGAVLYKLLTGRTPHDAGASSTSGNTLDVMLGKAPIPAPSRINPAVPSDVDFVLKKALRHEPSERYASVDAFASDIKAILDSRPVEARAGDTWYRTRRFLIRYRGSVIAAALVLASLSGGLFLANRQRLAAEARFLQLRKLSQNVLKLNSPLALLPGATKIREQLVTTSTEYLEGISQEAVTDNTLALEIADSYLKIGRIQGVGWSYNLGKYDDGRKSLEKGLSFAEAVLTRSPKNRQALWLAASLCHDLGDIAFILGDRPGVESYGRQAARWLDSLMTQNGLERRDVNMATYSYSNLAEREVGLNHLPIALAYAQRGVEVSRNIQTIPGPKTQAIVTLAEVQRLMGDLETAAGTLRKAQSVYDSGSWDNEIYHKQIGNLLNYGQSRLYSSVDRIDVDNPLAAAGQAQIGFETSEALVKQDAGNDYMREISAAFSNQRGVVLTASDPAGALRAFDSSLARARELGTNVTGQRAEAVALANSSYALRKVGQGAEAGRRLDRAMQLFALTRDYPLKALLPWSEGEVGARALADHYAATGQTAKAIDLYRDVLNRIMATNPDELQSLPGAMCLSRYYSALIALLRQTGDGAGADDYGLKRSRLWEAWDRRAPNHPVIKRQLASTF